MLMTITASLPMGCSPCGRYVHDQLFFFFNDTATTEIYTLSLHDALPICRLERCARSRSGRSAECRRRDGSGGHERHQRCSPRSEEHTSELQSQSNLVCRLLLEKKQ